MQRLPDSVRDAAVKCSQDARLAWGRCLLQRSGKAVLRKTAPDWRKDPHAWAAWQGYRTACGVHGEGATFILMMLEEAPRKTWDAISELASECRRHSASMLPEVVW